MPEFEVFGTQYSIEVHPHDQLWPSCLRTVSNPTRSIFFAVREVLWSTRSLSSYNPLEQSSRFASPHLVFVVLPDAHKNPDLLPPPHPPRQCFCDMSLPAGFDGGYDGCTLTCAGNSGETCGGYHNVPKGRVVFSAVSAAGAHLARHRTAAFRRGASSIVRSSRRRCTPLYGREVLPFLERLP